MAMLRGAGLLLFAAACAALLALVSYHADDASLNNANGRDVSNLLGPLGAIAADLLLQTFGFAAVAFLAPPACLGHCARCRGKTLRYAMWRLVAWPLGTLTVAAGLGHLPGARQPAGRRGRHDRHRRRRPFGPCRRRSMATPWIGMGAAAVPAAGGPAAGVPGHRPALHAARCAASSNIPAAAVVAGPA